MPPISVVTCRTMIIAAAFTIGLNACTPVVDTTPPRTEAGETPPNPATPTSLQVAGEDFNERSRKRSAPPKVEPVVHNGVRYVVLRGAKGRGLPQNGGYIEATDQATGKELTLIRVYEVVYDKDVEDDKRDVYIIGMRLDAARDRLLIENERGRRFAVHLKDQKVEELRP